jgi:hypothetical protein
MYATNAANTNACPAGYSKITEVTTCKAAAAFLGRMFSGAFTSLLFPSGCYLRNLDTAVAFVYLNADPTGAANPTAQPLCLFGVLPQPPSAEHLRDNTVGGVPRQCPLPREHSTSAEYPE